MNRRHVLTALGIGAGAVVLSPMLDLAPIWEAPSLTAVRGPYAYATAVDDLAGRWHQRITALLQRDGLASSRG